MINAGTNGLSPVRNLYANPPTFHISEDPETVLYARRNAPPGFGVGLFAFIEDERILANSDIDDEDNDDVKEKSRGDKKKIKLKKKLFLFDAVIMDENDILAMKIPSRKRSRSGKPKAPDNQAGYFENLKKIMNAGVKGLKNVKDLNTCL